MSDLDLLTQSLARNVKHWRSVRGFTLDVLAARAAVSRGMLIQIEQARTNPSIGTVVKIGDALGVSITTLLDYEQGPKVRVVPAERAVRLWHTDAGSYNRLLAGTEAPGPLEMWDWRLMPGESSPSEPHPTGTVELVHVTTGELTLTVDGEDHLVPAGASATFEANTPHVYGNRGEAPMEMMMMVSVPPVRGDTP
ncbi:MULTISPECIES: XRE family transcriptional regulator [unclassified Streptomyces]|uniref:XRE family transcriptional regulator n=1 Tax=Streptomyces sp. R08 TaxID=3238624 RepID=A0AB39M7Y1_9ACTN|nr:MULTISPECIES: XRE family transcriptional regulator [unclassified Streptomyces]MCX4809461.1 XRE family transcriptional regulator [Streptomyces sp. NBC_01239]